MADPVMTLDMADIIAAQKDFMARSNNMLNSIPGAGEMMATAKLAAEQSKEGTSLANREIVNAAMATKAANFSAAALFGTTPGDPSAEIMQAASTVIASQKEFQTRADSIAKRRDVGFLDNPVEWFANQISVPFEIDKANAVLAQGKAAQDFISGQIKLTQDQVTLNNIANNAASADYLRGINLEAASKANKDLAAAQAQAANIGLQGVSIRNAITQQQWHSAVEINNAVVRAADYSLRTAEFDIHKEAEIRAEKTAALQNTIATYTIKNEEEKLKARTALDENLKVVTGVLGIAPLSSQQFMMMSDNSPLKQIIMNALVDPNFSEGRYAGTTWAASVIADKSQLLRMSGMAGTAKTVSLIAQVAADVEKKEIALWSTYPQELRNQKIEVAVKEKIAAWRKDAESGDNNPYATAGLQATMAMKRVEASPLTPYLMRLSNVNNDPDGLYKTKYTDILQAATQAVIDGKITQAQAVTEITDIYTSIATDLTTTRGYIKLAMPGISKESGYNITIRDPSLTSKGNLIVVNTLNPSANQANLIRALSARKLDEFRRDTFTSPTPGM